MATPSITLSSVGFAWPDGTVALSGVTGSFSRARTGLIGLNGSGKSTLLRLISGELHPTTGSIAVSGDIGVLPQSLPLSSGTVAEALGVAAKLDALRSIAAGEVDPQHFDAIGDDWDLESRVAVSLAEIGLPADAVDRPMAAVSGGEAVLVGIAGLRLRRTPVTLLDEPTNNLDRAARLRLHELVSIWKGALLVVSHDRELLDLLDETAELRDGALTVFGGNLSAYEEHLRVQGDAARRAVRAAEQHLRVEKRQLTETQTKLARRASTAKAKAASGGIPRIVAGGLKQSAQVSAGKARGEAESKVVEAAHELGRAEERVREDRSIHVDLPDVGLSTRRRIAEIRGDFAPVLIQGPERIALIGRNGAGKTTLLAALAGAGAPVNGIEVLPQTDRIGYLPQRIRLPEGSSALDVVRAAAPSVPPGEVRSRLARFLFRGDSSERLVSTLSGGQRFRVALAAVLLADPPAQLLMLDEPTNSLDLQSVTELVDALGSYSGAMIVVSHDYEFLTRLGIERWLQIDGGRLSEIAPPL